LNRAYDILRSGAWLTPERIRLVAVAILCVVAASIVFMLVTAHGLVDMQGRPLGTDFSSFYSAGTYVLEGNAQAPYDLARQHAREQAIFGEATPFYSWFYPPFFLFITAALALLPYGAAFVTWQVVTLVLYLLAIRAIVPSPRLRREGRDEGASPRGSESRTELLLAIAFPAVLSISVTARMASFRQRCSAALWPCWIGARSWPAFCSDCSPTNRNSD
jgi:alpha-1,2-mannosyltransferase